MIRTVINGFTFNGAMAHPMQSALRDALIGFLAALSQAQAEAEAEATKEAQRAGIAHAKAKGETSPYRGRAPSYNRAQLDAVRDMLGQGSGVSAAAKAASLSRQAVYRIQADPAGAEATLAMWSDLGAYPK